MLVSAGFVATALILWFTLRQGPVLVPRLPKPGSTEVVAFIPVGEVRRIAEFRWASPVAASRYIVVVRNGGTSEVLRRETAEQQLTVGPELSDRFHPGLYNWTVEAIDANGRVAAQSVVETFILRF